MVQYLSVYCTLTLHHVIECIPKRSELSVQYQTLRCKQSWNAGADSKAYQAYVPPTPQNFKRLGYSVLYTFT